MAVEEQQVGFHSAKPVGGKVGSHPAQSRPFSPAGNTELLWLCRACGARPRGSAWQGGVQPQRGQESTRGNPCEIFSWGEALAGAPAASPGDSLILGSLPSCLAF